MFSEFRFAARTLARWRGGLPVAVLTLAVGIGTTTALYTTVHVALGTLLDFPGVPDLDRVGRIYASSQPLGVERGPVALNEFGATLSRATSFESIGAYAQAEATVGRSAEERVITAGYASPGFFGAMAVPPLAGRLFTDADLATSQPVVILSDGLWRKEFPDRRLAGASLTIDGVERAVVGVMPPEFSYGFVGIGADVWIPMRPGSRETPAIVAIFARLRPGVGWQAADAELGALDGKSGPWTWRAIPIREDTRFRATAAYGFTVGPAIIILLIACVNVACMLLARGVVREKELSVRRALGATRARIVRQLLSEHLLLALAAGTLGGGLATALLRVLGASFASVQPGLAARLASDTSLLPVALAASLGASLLFGVLPATRLSRTDVAASLNGVPPRHRLEIAGYGGRDLVVFIEVGSAVGLLVFAAMLYNLFAAVRLAHPTFAADHVIAMRVAAGDANVVSARMAAIPGITDVTIASGMPGGSGAALRAQNDQGRVTTMSRVGVGERYAETLGLALVRGRTFDAGELRGHAGVAMLSESAARVLAPGGEPIGMRLQFSGRTSTSVVVIGVCRDAIDYGALSRAGLVPPEVYMPYDGSTSAETIVLAHTATDGHAFLRAVANTAAAPPGSRRPQPLVVGDTGPLADRDNGLLLVRMLGGFGFIALLLAATGVFGVISQSVAQRTREFGIRMALGATPRGVLWLVLARETKLIVAALTTGAAFTLGLTRALFVELARLSATAPSVWIVLVGICGGIAAIACWLATWRIVSLEPSAVLRRH